MLSTSDNPYNPWTDYDRWHDWDISHGYDTAGYIAALSNTLSSMDDEDNEVVYNEAVLNIVEQNITGTYIIVPQPADYVAVVKPHDYYGLTVSVSTINVNYYGYKL